MLEIGSGWGGFAIECVKKTGCKITTITISEEQFKEAKKRVKENGLSDKIDVVFSDYRLMQGQVSLFLS